MVSTVPRMRRNRSLSVAKYQPKSTSMARPIKKVRTGVMEFSMPDLRFSFCSSALLVRSGLVTAAFTLRLFQDVGNRRFVDLDFYVVSYLHEHGGLFHVRNETVNAGVGHDAVTGF